MEEHVRNEEVQNPENSKKMKEILHRFHEKYNQEDEYEGEDPEDFEEELGRLRSQKFNNFNSVLVSKVVFCCLFKPRMKS